ncbi:hypothetical protein [Thomasclavelia cocleata]|uniref:hypothetical protein n=1 Tax=Thomasclavelia cocleata TaxID=69824 RepID=UPI00258C3FA7|nr:hypothetical protein [Thomasclavelia cocleata]
MEYIFESFRYGILPTIIVLIYLVVNKSLEHHKELKKSKRNAEINADLLNCFNELNSYLHHITNDIVAKEKDKCVSTIRTSFKTMAYDLTKFTTFTIIANNIEENKKNIIDNIEYEVLSTFNSLHNELVYYDNAENPICSFIEENWQKELINDIENIVFSLPNSKEQRIYNIHNKLNIRINKYINKVVSKYLELDANGKS